MVYASFVFVVVTNMALNKHATQSSTCCNGDASRALNGNINTLWIGGKFSCTHTDPGDPSPWWKVDMGKEVAVSQVSKVISRM